MKQCTSSRILVVAAIFNLVLPACQKKPQSANPASARATIANLQTSYSCAKKRLLWYSRFSENAEKEHLSNVAALFKAIARSEEIHAANHANLLRMAGVEAREQPIDSIPMGVTRQSIKMALSMESFECESLYPSVLRAAEAEKWLEAATQFKQTKGADARHQTLLKQASEFSGNMARTTYYICPGCGYIATTEQTELCPICSMKNEKFVRI
jgi:rubrerythrin